VAKTEGRLGLGGRGAKGFAKLVTREGHRGSVRPGDKNNELRATTNPTTASVKERGEVRVSLASFRPRAIDRTPSKNTGDS